MGHTRVCANARGVLGVVAGSDAYPGAAVLGAAGALSGVAEYEKYRERGADLPPLPTLFVVVDEFSELVREVSSPVPQRVR